MFTVPWMTTVRLPRATKLSRILGVLALMSLTACGDGESEAYLHSGGVGLDGGRDEFANLGKVGDRVAIAGAGYANHADINYVPSNLAAPIQFDPSTHS